MAINSNVHSDIWISEYWTCELVCEPWISLCVWLHQLTNTMCLQKETCEGIILTSPLNSPRRCFRLYFSSFLCTYFPSVSSIFLSVRLHLSQRSFFFYFAAFCRVKMWSLQNVSCYESMKKNGRSFERVISPAKFEPRVTTKVPGSAEIQQQDKQIENYNSETRNTNTH